MKNEPKREKGDMAENLMEILPECVYRGLRAWIDDDYVRNVRKHTRAKSGIAPDRRRRPCTSAVLE